MVICVGRIDNLCKHTHASRKIYIDKSIYTYICIRYIVKYNVSNVGVAHIMRVSM